MAVNMRIFNDMLATVRKARTGRPSRKAVLMVLAEHCGLNEHGQWSTFVGQVPLSAQVELSDRQVRRIINQLVEDRWLTKTHRGRAGGKGGRDWDEIVLNLNTIAAAPQITDDLEPDTVSGNPPDKMSGNPPGRSDTMSGNPPHLPDIRRGVTGHSTPGYRTSGASLKEERIERTIINGGAAAEQHPLGSHDDDDDSLAQRAMAMARDLLDAKLRRGEDVTSPDAWLRTVAADRLQALRQDHTDSTAARHRAAVAYGRQLAGLVEDEDEARGFAAEQGPLAEVCLEAWRAGRT